MNVLLGLALLAQGYLVEHPIDDSMMVLATHEGRYSVTVYPTCGFGPGRNYQISGLYGTLDNAIAQWHEGDFALGMGLFEDDKQWCALTYAVLVDPTPCFTNADGDCDVAEEYGP